MGAEQGKARKGGEKKASKKQLVGAVWGKKKRLESGSQSSFPIAPQSLAGPQWACANTIGAAGAGHAPGAGILNKYRKQQQPGAGGEAGPPSQQGICLWRMLKGGFGGIWLSHMSENVIFPGSAGRVKLIF